MRTTLLAAVAALALTFSWPNWHPPKTRPCVGRLGC